MIDDLFSVSMDLNFWKLANMATYGSQFFGSLGTYGKGGKWELFRMTFISLHLLNKIFPRVQFWLDQENMFFRHYFHIYFYFKVANKFLCT